MIAPTALFLTSSKASSPAGLALQNLLGLRYLAPVGLRERCPSRCAAWLAPRLAWPYRRLQTPVTLKGDADIDKRTPWRGTCPQPNS